MNVNMNEAERHPDMNISPLKVGDLVAIRGDLRINLDGRCAYTPDQLVDGRYLRHTGHGGIWLGIVDAIDGAGGETRALVGGGWRRIDRYEVMPEAIRIN